MKQLGPYKLESVLGRGGMGTVYRAVDVQSNEPVAVKVLATAYAEDKHFRKRFEAEINSLLKLDHPNIVRLVGYGQDDHHLFFAMELVEGSSLFQLQRGGEIFDWREVLRIAKNVALGLRHAHDRGVIHRDLKPGNLLKARSGIIKITDFGIAKNYGEHQNTGTNVVGTMDFMSPEQAQGQPVTFSSDLFSLGGVMFTLLVGRPPFAASSMEASLRNLTKIPAPRADDCNPNVPIPVSDLIGQLLKKEPGKRVPTALALYHQLKQVELKLLDSSQAKTSEWQAIRSSEQTSAKVDPKTDVDRFRVKVDTVEQPSAEEFVAPSTSELASDVATDAKAAVVGQSDGTAGGSTTVPRRRFFKKVTDELRSSDHGSVSLDSHPSHSLTSKVMLGLALVFVLALAGFGVYLASRPPTAEALLAAIESHWEQPHKRIDEINQFLELYPDHVKVELLKERQELATITQTTIRLRSQRRQGVPLSVLQEQFLLLMDRVEDDLPGSMAKLRALVTLHERERRTADDDECLSVARLVLSRMESTAEKQIAAARSSIERQLARAAKLPPDEAAAIYESIVELNGQHDWVADLVNQAQELLERGP